MLSYSNYGFGLLLFKKNQTKFFSFKNLKNNPDLTSPGKELTQRIFASLLILNLFSFISSTQKPPAIFFSILYKTKNFFVFFSLPPCIDRVRINTWKTIILHVIQPRLRSVLNYFGFHLLFKNNFTLTVFFMQQAHPTSNSR